MNWDSLKNQLEIVKSAAISVATIAGLLVGLWAFIFDDWPTLKRKSQPILNISLQARQVGPPSQMLVVAEATLDNAGQEALLLNHETMDFYISRLESMGRDGIGRYGKKYKLRFDYHETTLRATEVVPIASPDKMQAVQRVAEPGLYLARLVFPIESEKSTVYSSATYVWVDDCPQGGEL